MSNWTSGSGKREYTDGSFGWTDNTETVKEVRHITYWPKER